VDQRFRVLRRLCPSGARRASPLGRASFALILVLVGVGILFGLFLTRWGRETPEMGPPWSIPGAQGRVRVEVLNGSGVAGVAWDATRVLRDKGFDVVLFGNAGSYSDDSSVVIQLRSEPDSTLFVDVTVRLGPDWTGPPSNPKTP